MIAFLFLGLLKTFFFYIWKVFPVIKNTIIDNESKALNSDKEPHCTDIITNINLFITYYYKVNLNIVPIHT